MTCGGALRIDGPPQAPCTVLLAHGAGAGMDSPFLIDIARGLAASGLRVVRFEFPYMAARREGRRPAPDRLPVLQQALRDAAASFGPPARLVLAGKSMGGRVATTVADELGVAGVLVFGYPFHPPRRPEQQRTGHLRELRTPTRILQGERDPFGTRPEVESYPLSPAIELCWFEAADHSLEPGARSGIAREAHLQRAIGLAAAFARSVSAIAP